MHNKQFSCEFFPPRTDEGAVKLLNVREKLSKEIPLEYFSVTYGAGGSTRERTLETVKAIQPHASVAPHITCIASETTELNALLDKYVHLGVNRLVVLRGDAPSGMGLGNFGDFRHAVDLVHHIKNRHDDMFTIEVAAYPEFHPQALSAQKDIDFFIDKVKAGANSAITQYFYNADSYFSFIEILEKRGVNIPIYAGIMPITNFTQLARFSEMCGAEIPRWIAKTLEGYGDDIESIKAFGLDVVSNLTQTLLDSGAPGIHFYTMNQIEPTLNIWDNLK